MHKKVIWNCITYVRPTTSRITSYVYKPQGRREDCNTWEEKTELENKSQNT
jgi:hypothetical protein